MIGTWQFIVASIALLLQSTVAILSFMSVITNEWIVVNEAATNNATIIIGLTRECHGSHCFERDFGRASSCGKSSVDVRDRYRGILAFLVVAFLCALVSVVLIAIAQYALQKVKRSIAMDTSPQAIREEPKLTRAAIQTNIERLTISSNRVSGVLATSFITLLCLAIGIGLFNNATDSFVHCGKSICDYMKSLDASTTCDRGDTYTVGFISTFIASAGLVVILGWWVLNRREKDQCMDVLESILPQEDVEDPPQKELEIMMDGNYNNGYGDEEEEINGYGEQKPHQTTVATARDPMKSSASASQQQHHHHHQEQPQQQHNAHQQQQKNEGGRFNNGSVGSFASEYSNPNPGGHTTAYNNRTLFAVAQEYNVHVNTLRDLNPELAGFDAHTPLPANTALRLPTSTPPPQQQQEQRREQPTKPPPQRPTTEPVTPSPEPQEQRRSVSPAPQVVPQQRANDGATDGATDDATEVEPLPPPEEGVWVKEPDSGLYWCDEEQLYFDPMSGHFYDPVEDKWYNPDTDEWYGL